MKKLLILILLAAAAPALAQSSSRSQKSEIYIGPVFTDGKNYNFNGGSSARTDTGVGLNIGFAYNADAHLQAGIDIAWSEQDYRATVQPGDGSASRNINGTLESSTLRFHGTYHFSAKRFTPLVTGGLGWTYVDTNIPSGLPENVCWYYPWYGGYCATYVPTQSTTKFSYNLGAGLRLDHGSGVFRFLVNSQWMDLGGAYSSANLIQYRIDFGTKF
jgi:opacity protein-like surface antigen